MPLSIVELSTLVVFIGASTALIVSPGPDTVYVLTQGIGSGRDTGIAAACGTTTGILVHTAAAVVGLSVLLRTSAVAFSLVKYAGAFYLCYLGIKTIRNRAAFAISDGDAGRHPMMAYRDGATINILNPQVALFFLAFLPQFVDGGGQTSVQLFVLGGIYAVITLLYLTGVAIAANGARQILSESPRLTAGIRWLTGSVLVGFGLQLLIGEQLTG